MKLSRRSQVDPFIVMDVMEAARAAEAKGRRIIHMEVGQPSTLAPVQARQVVAESLVSNPLGYTVALGLPDLRQGIARLYMDWYGLDLDPSRVVVTSGSSAGFLLAFTALFDPNARVGVASPGYPSYRQILKALSLQPVDISTDADKGYQLSVQDVAALQLDGLLVASPGNPTGTMLEKPALQALADHAKKSGIGFISDEIYHGIEYEKKAVTALEVTNTVYVINSFSKYFSMTGWRVGWLVVPQDHVRSIERLAQNMFICPPHISQIAALKALDCGEEMEKNLAVYAENRRLMLAGLPQAGITQIAPPDGAFYIYADISKFGVDSRIFAAQVLADAGVAITPGLDFDPLRGAHTIRLSYAQSTDEIVEGLCRLKAFMLARYL
ncbi:MAG TPA: 1-aminocyclopropane-1-carboxylate deaminase [Rhodobacteraceae bacterium]|nr:1-aminocyclopropane-1-carboxylate deaminase [Paracoccaceae bacterium]|tara:strand:- start:234 stop:1382 length:1149 start_codon:yes stop_codon:yes gene_type:complete